jgi:hypothetical protein
MTTTTTPMNPDEKKAIEYCLDHDNFSTNELPVRTDVCHRCQGTGVTWGGIVLGQSDFDEDPYLHESIMNGSFDRPCEECNGNKVLQYVNWDDYDSFPKTHSLRLLREMLEDIWESRAMEAAERRAGC